MRLPAFLLLLAAAARSAQPSAAAPIEVNPIGLVNDTVGSLLNPVFGAAQRILP